MNERSKINGNGGLRRHSRADIADEGGIASTDIVSFWHCFNMQHEHCMALRKSCSPGLALQLPQSLTAFHLPHAPLEKTSKITETAYSSSFSSHSHCEENWHSNPIPLHLASVKMTRETGPVMKRRGAGSTFLLTGCSMKLLLFPMR